MSNSFRSDDVYVLEGAAPVRANKFLRFSVKEKKVEKGVGDDFSVAEFDVVAGNRNNEIRVKLDKKGA